MNFLEHAEVMSTNTEEQKATPLDIHLDKSDGYSRDFLCFSDSKANSVFAYIDPNSFNMASPTIKIVKEHNFQKNSEFACWHLEKSIVDCKPEKTHKCIKENASNSNSSKLYIHFERNIPILPTKYGKKPYKNSLCEKQFSKMKRKNHQL
ncbi:hypothetical protein EDEG_03877 [Edhazardia aedis USNM 41457]|uniref:Uncharacterized protein n=1 Tax=Edhazardia aedis (strain USNM 41457) TaxID=1003232 RepID=J8ZPF9_EDHAE|nr:hypothetical protein EDEG_03877 [Edhazardia aedis USNM 41457]|eukprot:EJW01558.1 hypothetical protein EDEG_03877 [Edhazardia aedis USNM 41457]